MPIHDVGYRTWTGHVTSKFGRWWTISEAGIKGALKSAWVRRFLLMSWGPVIYFGLVLFFIEQVMSTDTNDLFREVGIDSTEMVQPVTRLSGNETLEEARKKKEDEARARMLEEIPFFRSLANSDAMIAAFETGDQKVIRSVTWNWMLSNFLRYPQSLLTLLIVGLIVPPLISRDVRSRAFLLYYSRPISRMEYLVGKLAIPAAILFLITLVPAMVLYCLAVMLSPDLTALTNTWTTPIRIFLATLVCVIPTSLISLFFSSMTQESRFASFAWFSVWGIGAGVWGLIYLANSQMGTVPYESNWSLISIYSTIGEVQAWIFGLKNNFREVMPSAIFLAVITLAAFIALYRRVSAPVRI